jgi:hypothetical protein
MIHATGTKRFVYGALLALILLLLLMPAVSAAVGEAFKIETEPLGAKIWIDGNYRGLSDKDTVFYSFETGPHLVRLELDGYEPYEVVKTVSEGASELVYHKFKPIPTTGQIDFASTPTGADIILDGRNVGKTPYTLRDVEPGEYTVIIRHRGYNDWTGRVNVEVGKLSEVKAELVPSDTTISVTTVPAGFELYIDGVDVGTTPYSGTISQGRHDIRIEKLGFRTIEETLIIGYEGADLTYVPETTIPEAIAEVEAAITANLKYNPVLAKTLIEEARAAYERRDFDEAINLTQRAMIAAEDVDLDDVKNADDMVAEISNNTIYMLPVILALVIVLLVAANVMRHRVKPIIVLDVPKALRAAGESPQYLKFSVDAKGGKYRAFVCTVYLDGRSMEHFVAPGSYEVLISGEHKSVGEHTAAVELKISKTRYGVASARTEETYTVFDDNSIIDSDSLSLMEDGGGENDAAKKGLSGKLGKSGIGGMFGKGGRGDKGGDGTQKRISLGDIFGGIAASKSADSADSTVPANSATSTASAKEDNADKDGKAENAENIEKSDGTSESPRPKKYFAPYIKKNAPKTDAGGSEKESATDAAKESKNDSPKESVKDSPKDSKTDSEKDSAKEPTE